MPVTQAVAARGTQAAAMVKLLLPPLLTTKLFPKSSVADNTDKSKSTAPVAPLAICNGILAITPKLVVPVVPEI